MARRRIEEEKQRLRQRQKDAVMGFVRQVRLRGGLGRGRRGTSGTKAHRRGKATIETETERRGYGLCESGAFKGGFGGRGEVVGE